jgi:polar amino acid transport system permease protein
MSATTDTPTMASRPQMSMLDIAPRRHIRRHVVSVIMGVLLLDLLYSMVTNSRYQWHTVGSYLFNSEIVSGLERTMLLTAVAMLMGIIGGTLLAIMRLSDSAVVRRAAGLYVWFFRGTPLMVQLIFWFNLSALYPTLTLGVPFGGPSFLSGNANSLITVYVAAFLGLGLNEAAYMSEIVRAGINSVDDGQAEAAQALGMHRSLVFRRIVMPQAMRVVIPPTANQVIGMLKTTSLVLVIALPDLLYSAQLIYQRNFQPIPLLIVASIWYLVLTTVLSIGQHYIEKRYSRGSRHGRADNGSSWREWRGRLARVTEALE